jgi:hypothetical protein
MQSIVDSILDKCDGHLLAVDMLGKALRRYKTAKGWQCCVLRSVCGHGVGWNIASIEGHPKLQTLGLC